MPDPVNPRLSAADRASIEAALAKVRAEGGNPFLEGHLEAALEGEPRVRPFSNGSQMGDWVDRNCECCPKVNFGAKLSDCEIYDAVVAAYVGDGSVPAEIAQRMGYRDSDDAYQWDCPERESPNLEGE